MVADGFGCALLLCTLVLASDYQQSLQTTLPISIIHPSRIFPSLSITKSSSILHAFICDRMPATSIFCIFIGIIPDIAWTHAENF